MRAVSAKVVIVIKHNFRIPLLTQIGLNNNTIVLAMSPETNAIYSVDITNFQTNNSKGVIRAYSS